MYKVLVVEDETIIRKGLIYSVQWGELDCNVVAEATNGKEGIDKIRRFHPDIVIADINMPILNGIEMIKETIGESGYSAIIISGYNEFEFAKQAIKFGVSEYLLKPVDHDELRDAIRRAIVQIEMKHSYRMQTEKKASLVQTNLMDNQALRLDNKSRVVVKMIEYIKSNYRDKILMFDLVEELGCSATLLNNKFKKETGTTFNDFLNRYRLIRSITLIKEHQLPLYKIAEATGFKNYKYFNFVFNKYIGCSPKAFEQASL